MMMEMQRCRNNRLPALSKASCSLWYQVAILLFPAMALRKILASGLARLSHALGLDAETEVYEHFQAQRAHLNAPSAVAELSALPRRQLSSPFGSY